MSDLNGRLLKVETKLAIELLEFVQQASAAWAVFSKSIDKPTEPNDRVSETTDMAIIRKIGTGAENDRPGNLVEKILHRS